MKNHYEDAYKKLKNSIRHGLFFDILSKKNPAYLSDYAGCSEKSLIYFCRYITSFTSFTVRGTSGKAAATRFGA
jgi:hypothetical protein